MIVVHFGFGMNGPWGEEMSNTLDGLAHDINNTEGLVWKIWTENEKEGRAGGIYLFEDEQSAENYISMHSARVSQMGATEISVDRYMVNEPLSLINRAQLSAHLG